MIRYLANCAADLMQRRYEYDGSYLREVAQVSRGGALRLGVMLPLLSGYRSGVPVDLWAGAAVASTRDGDCGPCLQLVVNMALEQGADAQALRAILQGSQEETGVTGLGYRFALAAINDGPELDTLRGVIGERYGERALVSLSIAAATGRAWPVIKRGLGHGQVCRAVTVAGQNVDLAASGATCVS